MVGPRAGKGRKRPLSCRMPMAVLRSWCWSCCITQGLPESGRWVSQRVALKWMIPKGLVSCQTPQWTLGRSSCKLHNWYLLMDLPPMNNIFFPFIFQSSREWLSVIEPNPTGNHRGKMSLGNVLLVPSVMQRRSAKGMTVILTWLQLFQNSPTRSHLSIPWRSFNHY